MAVWVLSFAYWLIYFCIDSFTVDTFITYECEYSGFFVYSVVNIVLVFLIPILTVVLFSVLIIFELKKKEKHRRTLTHNRVSPIKTTFKAEPIKLLSHNFNLFGSHHDIKGIICILTTIFGIFLAFSLYMVVWPLNAWCNCVHPTVIQFTYLITYVHSIVNPIAIFSFNHNVRKDVFKMFTRFFNSIRLIIKM